MSTKLPILLLFIFSFIVYSPLNSQCITTLGDLEELVDAKSLEDAARIAKRLGYAIDNINSFKTQDAIMQNYACRNTTNLVYNNSLLTVRIKMASNNFDFRTYSESNYELVINELYKKYTFIKKEKFNLEGEVVTKFIFNNSKFRVAFYPSKVNSSILYTFQMSAL